MSRLNLFNPVLFILVLFMLAFSQMIARAELVKKIQSGPWVGDPAIGEARLASAVNGTADLHELPLGLEFRLASG